MRTTIKSEMNCRKKDHEWLKNIAMKNFCPDCGERLAGVSPSGSDQLLVREHAERVTGKEQTDSAERPVVGQTKGGSERKRLVDQWRREAADARVTADLLKRHPITKSVADDLIDLAVVCERHAAELEAVFLSETQPQSGTGTVEEVECLPVEGGYRCGHDLGPGEWPCAECPHRRKRRDRSGSGNAHEMPPR